MKLERHVKLQCDVLVLFKHFCRFILFYSALHYVQTVYPTGHTTYVGRYSRAYIPNNSDSIPIWHPQVVSTRFQSWGAGRFTGTLTSFPQSWILRYSYLPIGRYVLRYLPLHR